MRIVLIRVKSQKTKACARPGIFHAPMLQAAKVDFTPQAGLVSTQALATLQMRHPISKICQPSIENNMTARIMSKDNA